MTAPTRDEAREDAAAYAKALIANRTAQAIAIEQKYDVFGYPPQIVSIALQAASEGRDHLAAIDEYLEGEEG